MDKNVQPSISKILRPQMSLRDLEHKHPPKHVPTPPSEIHIPHILAPQT